MSDGVGMFPTDSDPGFFWRVNGQAGDFGWRYLVQELRGTTGTGEPWDLQPDYQRPVCWTTEQREAFLGHVLGGGEVLPIYVHRSGLDVSEPPEVIDGQQRLNAIIDFVCGRVHAEVQVRGGAPRRFLWDHMSKAEQGYPRQRVIFVDLPRPDRLRFYLRLNGGTAHTAAELARVRDLLEGEGG